VHLVGFIIKKFITMHGHMNVEYVNMHVPICFLTSRGHIFRRFKNKVLKNKEIYLSTILSRHHSIYITWKTHLLINITSYYWRSEITEVRWAGCIEGLGREGMRSEYWCRNQLENSILEDWEGRMTLICVEMLKIVSTIGAKSFAVRYHWI